MLLEANLVVTTSGAVGAMPKRARIFKTASFSTESRRAGITDDELRRVAAELFRGVGNTNLGGGVRKARLGNGNYRAILLKSRGVWLIFVYLYNKQDDKNISEKVLKGFKKLAADFKRMPQQAFEALIANGTLVEMSEND